MTAWVGNHETSDCCIGPLPYPLTICWLTRAATAADLTVGAGFDTGTQGAILSVGTNDNLIDRTRIGGKDVSAKGETDRPTFTRFFNTQRPVTRDHGRM